MFFCFAKVDEIHFHFTIYIFLIIGQNASYFITYCMVAGSKGNGLKNFTELYCFNATFNGNLLIYCVYLYRAVCRKKEMPFM